ncbi:hypothetical protein GNP80_06335 [Aliivibrio fischeri]|nr:hypothetical protein [Aliivibrio fischeri]
MLFVITSFSKWLVTSVTLMALVLSSVAYSYPMKMEVTNTDMQHHASMASDCHSIQSDTVECNMGSMKMSIDHHCSGKGETCCKTACVTSICALPSNLYAYIHSAESVINYIQYNEQPRSFVASSLFRPPIL